MFSQSQTKNNTFPMRATSSRVVNASTSSAARSLLDLPARSASPPSLTELIKKRKRQEEESDRELLEGFMNRRETINRQMNTLRETINRQMNTLRHEQDSIDREVRKIREKLPTHVIDVDEEEEHDNYDESESEAHAKPVDRKKGSYLSSDDEDDDDDNTQNAPNRRLAVDHIPSDSSSLYNHQRLKIVLNALPINRGFTTQEIAQAYIERYPDQSHFTWGKNLRQYTKEQYIPDGCIRWNEIKAGGSTYTRLKRIPM
jgi:hypothetical protein